MGIETIIFYLGGVVVPEGWSVTQAKIAQEAKTTTDRLAEIINPLRPYATRGKLTLLEVYSKVAKELGLDNPQGLLDTHMELYKKYGTERNQDVISLIKKLKKNYRVVCLTNAEKEVTNFNRERGLFDYFDRAFISCDMGLMKPNIEIYEKALRDLNIGFGKAFFIDDKREYVEGARDVGITAVRFKTYNKLEGDLRLFNIL